VIVLVVLVGGVGAVFLGVGPAPGGDSGAELTDFPTATSQPTAMSSSGTQAPDTTAAATPTATPQPPYTFAIQSIEECGRTCRDVTAELANNRETDAESVVTYTRIFAGQDTTATEDLIWENRTTVGTIAAGATARSTQRVALSLQEGLAIENAGGWITILTTVQSAEETVTFRNSEQVA
jgi:hypothetical protein